MPRFVVAQKKEHAEIPSVYIAVTTMGKGLNEYSKNDQKYIYRIRWSICISNKSHVQCKYGYQRIFTTGLDSWLVLRQLEKQFKARQRDYKHDPYVICIILLEIFVEDKYTKVRKRFCWPCIWTEAYKTMKNGVEWDKKARQEIKTASNIYFVKGSFMTRCHGHLGTVLNKLNCNLFVLETKDGFLIKRKPYQSQRWRHRTLQHCLWKNVAYHMLHTCTWWQLPLVGSSVFFSSRFVHSQEWSIWWLKRGTPHHWTKKPSNEAMISGLWQCVAEHE